MPYRNGNIPPNSIIWTKNMLAFLKENFNSMTNKQLAKKLKLKLTSVRMKCYSLGLRRIEMEYWTKEQVMVLKRKYKIMGDVEIALLFQRHYPKNKKWTKTHIAKKRKYLSLNRTHKQVQAIMHKNASPGGRSYRIDKNSGSLHLQDGYIAALIAWRDPKGMKEILKYPEIIELKRELVKIQRTIKTKRL